MFLDNSLAFQGASGVGDWTATMTASTTADSSNVIDVMGNAWVTYSSQAGTPAMVTRYGARDGGADYGTTHDGVAGPWFYMFVTTAATASANTFTPLILAAPDSATGTYPNETHAPGTYATIWQGPTWTATALGKAGRFYLAPLPPTFIAVTDTTNPNLFTTAVPRFYKLSMSCSAAVTSLKIASGLVVNPSMAMINTVRNNLNYSVV